MINKIKIEVDKCVGCGLCSAICGSKVIEMENGKPIFRNPELCCSCGHCAAICPKEALQSEGHNTNDFEIIQLDSTSSEIEKLLTTKRSVREFKDTPLEKETIERLIAYAEKAPSSTNNRHRKYIVVTNTEIKNKIEKCVVDEFWKYRFWLNPLVLGLADIFSKKTAHFLWLLKKDIEHMKNEYEKKQNPVFRDAPAVIFGIAPKDDIQAKDDSIIAQQYMMLFAQSIGIGSCVIGYATHVHKALERVLKVPKGYSIFSTGIFGYQKYQYLKEIRYTKKPEFEIL